MNIPKLTSRKLLIAMINLALVFDWRANAQTPVAGHALNFDGQDDFVRVASNPIPTAGNFTIECWVNATAPSSFSFRTILSQATAALGPRFYIGIDPNDQIRAGDAWYATGVTLPLGAWHHIALVRTSTDTLLYLDGSLRASYGSAIPNPSAAPWLDIGQQFDDIQEFWNGLIDEVRIWKVVRTPAQIAANLSSRLKGNEAGLVAYYRFDSTGGSTATNSAIATGAVHNGFLTNGPAWVGIGVVTNHADSGPGSLRQTILDAQPGDYITFATNLSGSTILLTNGQLTLDKNLIIDGSMLQAGIQINGNHTTRCMQTAEGVTNVLTALTLTNGFVDESIGGAILSHGNLTLNRCTVAGNTALGNYPWGCGGGIYNWGNTLTLNQCTIIENSVRDSGGGVFNYVGTLRVDHCTVISNTSQDVIFSGGGGLTSYAGAMTLSNSIVCNNTALANTNVSGAYTGSGNFIDGDPRLTPLGNYGGPTLTLVPLVGSPVIDGAGTGTFLVDQRGLPRGLDGNGDGAGFNDIGAVEFQASPIITTLADSGEGSLRDAIASLPSGSTITFSNTISGGTITLTGGQIALEKDLTIDGSALPRGITIDGDHVSRIFQVGGGRTVVLNSLTIANGNDIGGGNDGGGGILSYGTLTLNKCTLTGNSASHSFWGGGGILSYQGALTINQCTLSGNSANNGTTGGGIVIYAGTLTVNQSTVSENSAEGGGGGISNGGTMTMINSIVAGNTPDNGLFSFTDANNLTSGNPFLAPLGNYGGPTPTMPPLPGSPAIDGCTNGSLFPSDQRGFLRPVDGDTNGVAVSDIGAVEFKPTPPKAGSYNGLFSEQTGARHDSAGFFSTVITKPGTYSAKILLAGKTYSFSGKFDLLGKVTKTLNRKGLSPLTVNLYSLVGDEIYGRISDGTWTAELFADRSTFQSVTNRAPAAGRYTMHIPRGRTVAPSLIGRQSPSISVGVALNIPGGDGYGAVTVSSKGVVALSGTLADGTKISRGAFLSKDNQWPLYLPLYAGGGSAMGWQNFTVGTPKAFTGDLLWTKRANAAAKFYPLGFTNQTSTAGSQYLAPAKGSRIVNITTGEVSFLGADVSRFSNLVALGTNNKIVNLSSNKLTLSFSLTSGTFTGTVVDPATFQPISFRGAVFQNENVGYGFFLHTNLSGHVTFQ